MSKPQGSTVLFDALGPRGRRKVMWASLGSGVLFLILVALAVNQLNSGQFFEQSRWVNPLDALIVESTWLPSLVSTLKAAALGSVGAVLLGVIVGMGRVSRFALIRGIAAVYVQFFRAMPVLLLIFIPFTLDGLTHFTADWLGADNETRRLIFLVLGLAVYNGAVLAEIVRSGVNSLPPGQAMAGHAIGLPHGKVMRLIVLPQALRIMLPSVLAQLVILLKDTALGYVITYPELLHGAGFIANDYGDSYLQVFIVAAFVYFVLAWALSQLVKWVERRTGRKTAAKIKTPAAVVATPSAGVP
ncbi:MAG: amino acid ABC transporter permease [Stackebrandtia sp.]